MAERAYFGLGLDVCGQRLTVLAVNDDAARCRDDALAREPELPVFVFDLMGRVKPLYDWLRSYGLTDDDARDTIRALGASVDKLTRERRGK